MSTRWQRIRKRIQPSPWLVLLLWRQALPVTAVAAAIAGLFALFWPQRLIWVVLDAQVKGASFWVTTFVLVHSIALVIVHGRPGSGAFAYLYTRGFTRDRLWLHRMLASGAAVLTVMLVVGLVTWTPLRAMYHDVMQQDPFYPGAAEFERGFLLRPLFYYALLLPPLHYVWIRLAQPMRGGLAGLWLTAWLVAAFVLMHLHRVMREATFAWQYQLVLISIAMAAVLLGLWGWPLHRRVEVTR